MKILVIGGTGNIGYYISKYLSENRENDVYVLARKNTSEMDELQVHFISGDGNNESFLTELSLNEKFDIVCNLIIYTEEQAAVNLRVFRRIVKQFIFVSTVVVYDREIQVVANENSAVFNKYSKYGQDKLKCENLLLRAYTEEGFPLTIVRPTQTYSGAKFPLSIKGNDYWNVINRIKQEKKVIIHGDGTSTWICTHSIDFARGFIGLVNNEKAIGEKFLITSDEIVDWNQIYSVIAKQLGVDLHIVHIPTDILSQSKKYNFSQSIQGDKQYSVIFDNSKIKSFVKDFKCEISIEEGCKMYLDYMNAHPELQIEDKEFNEWCDQIIEIYEKNIESLKQII